MQGALVEQAIGRSVLARYHAGFSLGTVLGALVGAGAAGIGLPVAGHLMIVAGAALVVVPAAVRSFLPDPAPSRVQPVGGRTGRRRSRRVGHPLTAWTEPRTLLIGVVALAFAFAEGSAIDWLALALVDDYGSADTVGILGFACFLTAMTAGRWVGPGVLDRHGRARVVRVLAVFGALGVVVFAVAPAVWLALVGVALWGLGTSLGFPIGMSAAADDPAHAAARVSVVASIGYCAYLAGPPLIGLLGDQAEVRHAVVVTAMLLAVAAVLAGRLTPVSAPRAAPSAAPPAAPSAAPSAAPPPAPVPVDRGTP